jgi:two-component system, NarL family, sensor histidine kinase UhpB
MLKPTPRDLPRRLLRVSALVLGSMLLLAAAVGYWKARADTDEEMDGALALVQSLRELTDAAADDDATLIAALQPAGSSVRHVQLALRDATGRIVKGEVVDTGRPTLAWPLRRLDGSQWTLVVSASPDSELEEALASLAIQLVLVAGGAMVLLTVMARRLQRAEAQRRRLAERLHSLQEDERRRLSQELHDELGQRLTAFRMDASVLHRRLPAGSADASLARQLAQQAHAAQQAVRTLLTRLAPRDGAEGTPEQLQVMLKELAQAQRGLPVNLDLQAGTAPLPQALLLAIYRISQEGLTNVVRHAGASQAWLALRREGDLLHWSLRDNGRGLPDPEAAMARGSGLAGLRERVWAFGGDLGLADAGPGLKLSASLRTAQRVLVEDRRAR